MSRRKKDRRTRIQPYRVSVTLEDIAYEGGALTRHDGKVIFADYGTPGEEVVVEVDRERQGVAIGRVVEVTSAADDRVEPPCPYFASAAVASGSTSATPSSWS